MPNACLLGRPQTSGISAGLDKDSLSLTAGVYRLRLAESLDDLEAAYRLRFLVFNLELGEGLEAAYEHGYETMITDWRMTNLLASRFWPRRGFRETFLRLYRSIP